MTISLSEKRVIKILTLCVLCLICANAVGIYSAYYLGHTSLFGMIKLFDLDREMNIPTFCSSLFLFFCSVLLLVIAHSKKVKSEDFALHWAVLASVFLFLSIDETVGLHERFTLPFHNLLHTSGPFFFAWIIPYGVCLAIFSLCYVRFLYALPRRFSILFITAGLIYVCGAIGIESISGSFAEINGQKNVTFALLAMLEESLEFVGVLVFIHALLSYISTELNKIEVIIFDS